MKTLGGVSPLLWNVAAQRGWAGVPGLDSEFSGLSHVSVQTKHVFSAAVVKYLSQWWNGCIARGERGWLLLAAVRGSVHFSSRLRRTVHQTWVPSLHNSTVQYLQTLSPIGDRLPTPALASEPRALEGDHRACYLTHPSLSGQM
jgi:hypothetical protein